MFIKELRQQIRKQRQAGQISFGDALRLQVALFNKTFAEAASQAALMEAISNEAIQLPYSTDGELLVGEINWAEVIKKIIDILLPTLLDLLDDWLS